MKWKTGKGKWSVSNFYQKNCAYCSLFTFQEKLQKHNFIICGNDDCGRPGNVFSFLQSSAMWPSRYVILCLYWELPELSVLVTVIDLL